MFLNARLEIPYNILLSTIIRDSGMTEYKQLRDSKRQIISCLEEMIKVGCIDRYEVETIFDEHKTTKILDVKFLLYISESFFADIQKSFLKDKDLSQILLYKQEEKRLREQAKKSKEEGTTDEMDTDTLVKLEIVKLLTSLDIPSKDINKILSSKKNQKNLEQVKNNIITAKNYIEKKQKNNNEEECNNIAIVLASIKDNWCVNKIDEETTTDNKKTKHNARTEEETKEDKTQDNLQKAKDYIKTIKNKKYKKISNNLLKYFGPNVYLAWLSNLKFVGIKDDTLILSCVNSFIIDTIKKDYLNGVYRAESDNTITWLRKGIREIIEETEPEIKKIEIVKVEK